jgi:magnesium transporter
MQSVTLTLQSFHGSRVGWGFLASALRRELATAAMLGAGCGCCIGLVVWLWKGAPVMAAAIVVAVAMAMVTAALLGVALPGALRALRHDPRIAAGPIVLALTDFAALMFYFSVASWLLGRVS